ncbi:MAG: hypothetical protein MZW92_02665 [Comamonadaceae bacterium]|nr:hypothetical protein [Comamonadaceae bacterium]
MLAIAVSHDAFAPASYDVFYLLVVATRRCGSLLLILAARPPYRGKPWVDEGFCSSLLRPVGRPLFAVDHALTIPKPSFWTVFVLA